jgi:hypothetical protein
MSSVLAPHIEGRIQVIRGLRVIVDVDLAALYGVPTKALNQAIKRNMDRFPPDFLFQLTASEKSEVVTNCDHLQKLKFSKTLPYAFTEHGAIQAANVLLSRQAVEMGIYVVRAFIQLSHDTFSRNTRLQLRQLLEAVRELTTPIEPPRRPIGFIMPDENSK